MVPLGGSEQCESGLMRAPLVHTGVAPNSLTRIGRQLGLDRGGGGGGGTAALRNVTIVTTRPLGLPRDTEALLYRHGSSAI